MQLQMSSFQGLEHCRSLSFVSSESQSFLYHLPMWQRIIRPRMQKHSLILLCKVCFSMYNSKRSCNCSVLYVRMFMNSAKRSREASFDRRLAIRDSIIHVFYFVHTYYTYYTYFIRIIRIVLYFICMELDE